MGVRASRILDFTIGGEWIGHQGHSFECVEVAGGSPNEVGSAPSRTLRFGYFRCEPPNRDLHRSDLNPGS